MRYSEIAPKRLNEGFYSPNDIYLHGGKPALDGGKLTRYGKSGGDMGALFFCKDEPVGRWYASTYVKQGGKLWTVKLLAPQDTIFDMANADHRRRLSEMVNAEEFAGIRRSCGESGHLDWTSVDDEVMGEVGFRGALFHERSKGMATGLPPSTGMAFLPSSVISVGIFDAADVEVTGFVPPDQISNYYR